MPTALHVNNSNCSKLQRLLVKCSILIQDITVATYAGLSRTSIMSWNGWYPGRKSRLYFPVDRCKNSGTPAAKTPTGAPTRPLVGPPPVERGGMRPVLRGTTGRVGDAWWAAALVLDSRLSPWRSPRIRALDSIRCRSWSCPPFSRRRSTPCAAMGSAGGHAGGPLGGLLAPPRPPAASVTRSVGSTPWARGNTHNRTRRLYRLRSALHR